MPTQCRGPGTRRDFVFNRHFLDEWLRRFPEAEVHRFADAGHFVLEDATEEIIALVHLSKMCPIHLSN